MSDNDKKPSQSAPSGSGRPTFREIIKDDGGKLSGQKPTDPKDGKK
jgi:hypothetical protein